MREMSDPANLPLFHLMRPAAEPSAAPPLLLLLHGVNSNEEDLFALAPRLDGRCVVVSARAPLVRAPGRYAWFDVTFLPEGFAINADQLAESRDRLAAFITAAAAAYGADPTRVYLFGFSQGAIMSLTLALTRPELVAGVVALSGRTPPEALPWLVPPARTEGLPVFQAHGVYDSVIPLVHAQRARAVLRQQRVALAYHEYPIGHSIPEPVFADATAFLAAQLAAAAWSAPEAG